MHGYHLPEHDWRQALQAAASEGDERPTWAYDWPAGARLAADLPDLVPLPGRRVVDLGCGRGALGLVALAHDAARVCFADGSPHPLRYLDAVLQSNGLTDRGTTNRHDWGEPLPQAGSWELILGGDILYRPDCFAALLQTIASSLAPGGVALLSDPRSQLEPQLPDLAASAGLTWITERPGDRYTLVRLCSR